MLEPERFYKLSNVAGSLGLSCNESGIALAGVPLMFRGQAGFQPRPEGQIRRLLTSAYGVEPDGLGLIAGLCVVARALNSGNMAHAMTAAVLLKIPELDWEGAARIAKADDAVAKYSEDQPRDWHGRWTADGSERSGPSPTEGAILPAVQETSVIDGNIGGTGSSRDAKPREGDTAREESGAGLVDGTTPSLALPSDWIHLPPGERNDELGDLLEWIANAKPEDALAIHHEIDRVYRDNGDITGAFVLHAALNDVLEDQGSGITREEVLRDCEYLTRGDPTQMISYMTLGDAAMALGSSEETASGRSSAMGLGPAEAASLDAESARAARIEYTRSSVWTQLGWAARGNYFEDTFGGEQDLAPRAGTHNQ